MVPKVCQQGGITPRQAGSGFTEPGRCLSAFRQRQHAERPDDGGTANDPEVADETARARTAKRDARYQIKRKQQ